MKSLKTIMLMVLICISGIHAQNVEKPALPQKTTSRSVELPPFNPDEVKVVTHQPEGEVNYYIRTGMCVSTGWDGISAEEQSSMVAIVFADDNKVWIKNPVSGEKQDTWIEGTYDGANNMIKVAAGQYIDFMPSIDFARQVWMLSYDMEEETYIPDPSITEIVYKIEENTISLEGTSADLILGSVYREIVGEDETSDYEGYWAKYGDYDSVYLPFDIKTTSKPEGLPSEIFNFKAPIYLGYTWNMTIKEASLAFDGDDVYLSGFSYYDPDWCIKGTRSGDNLIFNSPQFLGIVYDNPYFLISQENGEMTDIVFRMTAGNQYESDNEIYYSMQPDELFQYSYYDGAVLTQSPLPELVTPTSTARLYTYRMDYEGYIESIDFYYPSSQNMTVGIAGNKIFMSQLYYGVPDSWVEGEIKEGKAIFKAPQYMGYLSTIYPEAWFTLFGDNKNVLIDEITFDYDEATGSLTNASANISISICERRNLGLQWFFSPSFTRLEIEPATPANPRDLRWKIYDYMGVADFIFEIPVEDIDGNELVDNRMYYRIFTETDGNRDVFVMTPEDYPDMNLSEPIDLFPYNFLGYDISWAYGSFYVTIRGGYKQYQRIGVQSIYDANGNICESEVVWLDLPADYQTSLEENNEVEVLDRFTVSSPSGIILNPDMPLSGIEVYSYITYEPVAYGSEFDSATGEIMIAPAIATPGMYYVLIPRGQFIIGSGADIFESIEKDIDVIVVEDSTLGLDNSMMEETREWNVYDFNGVHILQTDNFEDLKKLSSGFYIVNGKKVMLSF